MDCEAQSAALPQDCHHPAGAAAGGPAGATVDQNSMASPAHARQVAATSQLVVQQRYPNSLPAATAHPQRTIVLSCPGDHKHWVSSLWPGQLDVAVWVRGMSAYIWLPLPQCWAGHTLPG